MEANDAAQRSKLERFRDELSQEFSALRATYNEVSGSEYINSTILINYRTPSPFKKKKRYLYPRHVTS